MPFLLVPLALIITLPIAGRSFYKKEHFAGVVFCLLLAFPAFYLGQRFPLAGGPVIGILLGLLIANSGLKLPKSLNKGISISGKKVLQMAIVLMGFQMNFRHVISLGTQALLLIFAAIVAAVLVAYFIGKAIGVSENDRTLIGVGTAICGGSAIAAVSPILKAEEEAVARSISVIFLFNVIAAFSFPAIGHLLGMTDLQFGMWAGAAINDTSSVVAASFTYSDAAGEIATVVKLTRTLMIIPFCLLISLQVSKRESKQGGNLSIAKTFPWFVLGFLIASAINTAAIVPSVATSFWGNLGRFFIIIAMVGIGLSCNLSALVKKGKKPILLGFCCSVTVAIVSLGVIYLMGM